jgi:hypothetical protein
MAFDRGEGSTGTGSASVLPIAGGGTGADNAADALTNLGAYPLSNPANYSSTTGTVTSVVGTGTASGLSLTGTVTTSGSITLGGTVNSLAAGTYAIDISGNAASATTVPNGAITAAKLESNITIPFADGSAATPSITNTGDTNTGVYFPAADTVGVVTNGSERMRIASDGQLSAVIPGGSTLYPSFTARAWVNFNGEGTVAIRASGNVSSITDNGTGDYTVNFTTAMPDANYGISLAAGAGGSGDAGFAYSYASPTSSGLEISVSDPFSFNLIDRPFVYAVIHR